MQPRLLAGNVALVFVLTIAGCTGPIVADACPVCQQHDDGTPLFLANAPEEIGDRGRGPVPTAVTELSATADVWANGSVGWTVRYDLDVDDGESLADSATVAERARRAVHFPDGAEGTVRSVRVRQLDRDRAVLTFVVDDRASVAAGDVVVYEGLDVADDYEHVVVNAEELRIVGLGGAVVRNEGGGTLDEGGVRYDEDAELETDTLVVFAEGHGLETHLAIRRALWDYHADGRSAAAQLLVLPLLVGLASFRWGIRRIDDEISTALDGRERFVDALLVVLAAGVAVGGTVAGIGPVPVSVTAIALVGAALGALGLFGVRSTPIRVAGALLAPTTLAVALAAGITAASGGTGALGPLTGLPSRAIPATVVLAIPAALGARGELTRPWTILGTLVVGALTYGLALGWWWPTAAPLGHLELLVAGGVTVGFEFAMAGLAFALGAVCAMRSRTAAAKSQ